MEALRMWRPRAQTATLFWALVLPHLRAEGKLSLAPGMSGGVRAAGFCHQLLLHRQQEVAWCLGPLARPAISCSHLLCLQLLWRESPASQVVGSRCRVPIPTRTALHWPSCPCSGGAPTTSSCVTTSSTRLSRGAATAIT